MSSLTLRFLAPPNPLSPDGHASGGAVMGWIDEAAQACAMRWAKGRCVSVAVGSMRFARPVVAGALVEVEARLASTGRSSMNLSVEVRSGDPRAGAMHAVTECLVVFAALDAQGQATPVAPWRPETPGDVALAQRVQAYLDGERQRQGRA